MIEYISYVKVVVALCDVFVADKLGFAFRLVKADILGNVTVSFSAYTVHFLF